MLFHNQNLLFFAGDRTNLEPKAQVNGGSR